jgi:hypothetical protein
MEPNLSELEQQILTELERQYTPSAIGISQCRVLCAVKAAAAIVAAAGNPVLIAIAVGGGLGCANNCGD